MAVCNPGIADSCLRFLGSCHRETEKPDEDDPSRLCAGESEPRRYLHSPNYGVPRKKKCEVELDHLDSAAATEACEATKYTKDGELDEPCYLFPPEMKLGGWMHNIGKCENKIEDLQGPDDTCRKASAREKSNPDTPDTLGMINNKVFSDNCAAIKDPGTCTGAQDGNGDLIQPDNQAGCEGAETPGTWQDGNPVCDFTPPSDSEKAWTLFSVLEMISFSSALLMFGFVLTGQ